MLAWALIINNLGRRRYPIYWWAAGKTFVSAEPLVDEKERQRELGEVEAGLRSTEGALFGRASGEGDELEGSSKPSDREDRAGDPVNNGVNHV